jgi:non-specific serine/threonine protein kinase
LVSESTAALVDLPLEDLGEHAVNDFPSARRIFHLPVEGRGRESFPPIRTLRVGRTNLPDQVSSFVGREHELAELRTLLAGRRVVTLTGPGGVGKTRLALRLAAELLDGSGDGVWFVDLAPVVDRQLVGPTVAEAVGLPERPGRPALETLVEGLADRALLVVMDNCEHVVDAAATVVAGLVERCPGVSVLATSREPLRIPGEQVYRVPSLSTPDEAVEDVDELARAEAVCLFIERASQQRSGFALARENAATVARVCRRLDGIPLAIELAAVRVRSLSIADLDARLDQRFALLRGGSRTALPRQQTLLALIDWSYQLLSDAERRVLSHLSVFAAGGFDLEAAEAVCSIGGVDPSDLLDHLDMLVDKSLVQAEDSSSSIRYGLLETVREYAGLKLANRGEAEIKQARLAHRDHYLRLAEAVNQVLLGTDRRVGLDRLSIEQPNLRAALLESLNDPDPKPGLRLATALQAFWKARGHDAEGAAELTRQLRRPEAREPTLTRGRTLAAAADLYPETLGEFRTAIAYAEEALEIARLHADDPLAADALSSLTWSHLYVGEPDRAVAFGDEGVSLARKLGGGYVLSGMLGARGAALANLGREARPDLEEALEVARVTGNGSFVAGALSNLGYLELTAGDPSRAREHLEEALAVSRGLDEPRKAINSTINLGFACYLEGDGMTATARFAEVIRTADRNDLPSPLATALLGAALSSAVSPAAAQLHGAADALMHRVGLALDSFEAGLAEAHLKMLRTKLGRDAFQTAYEFGHRLKHEDAIALALPGSCAPRPLDL